MFLLDNSFVTWSNRPYFDLEFYNSGAIHIRGIDYSYNNLVEEIQIPDSSTIINPVTIVHPISFRESLIRESGLFQYQVSNPLQLAEELRTERWNTLCDYLTHYQELPSTTKLRVIYLLSNLCLHDTVLEYVPVIPKSEIASDSTLASLAFRRAISNLMLQPDAGTLDNLKEFEMIANHAPLGSQIRWGTAVELVVLSARTFRNLKAAEFWRTVAIEALEHLKPTLDDFGFKYLTSFCYRALVFVPLLQKDKETVIREMDICQSIAEELTRECKNETEQIAAHENLYTVFESRTKEALWLHNIDLAEERAKKVVQMEPLYSRHCLELGEILLKQNKIEEAAKMYRSAARLGPPGTAIAWFMAGQCHEKIGDLDVACDCYLASVQMDELAISAVEKLNKLAPRLGNSALVKWSQMRLQELQEQQKTYINQPRTSYIPEASSELKLAGEKALTQI